MTKKPEQVTGWKSYRFNYGCPVDRFVDEAPEEYSNAIYKPEKIADGCYLSEVDFDRLDSQ